MHVLPLRTIRTDTLFPSTTLFLSLVAIDPNQPAPGLRVALVGDEHLLFADGEAWPFSPPRADHATGGHGPSDGAILSPMPGRIISVAVENGEEVEKIGRAHV